MTLSGSSQTDSYANQALKFSKAVVNVTDSLGVLRLLNDSLVSESTFTEIEFVRGQLGNNSSRIQFYLVKVDTQVHLYNINLHDPSTREQFGDFRVLFNNEEDFLIDKWKYFPSNESKKNEEEIIQPLNIPAPPPPPPPKNK